MQVRPKAKRQCAKNRTPDVKIKSQNPTFGKIPVVGGHPGLIGATAEIQQTLCLKVKGSSLRLEISENSLIKKYWNLMKNLFEGKKIYCGIDVHLKSWEIQVLTKNSVQKRIHMNPPSSQKVASYLEKNYPGGQYLCAYEAGFSGFWLQRELSELGIETLVLHSADIPTSDKVQSPDTNLSTLFMRQQTADCKLQMPAAQSN